MANFYGGKRIQNITQTLERFEAAEENYRDDAHEEKYNFWWILIRIAMKLPILPSVRPTRKCRVGKQDSTQVSPWVN